MLLTKITTIKQTSSTLKGFVRPIEGKKVQYGDFFDKRTKEGFNPIAYILLAKAITMTNEQKLKETVKWSKFHDLP